uniref:Uncharacterized protein n=1 Tax=Candidatus Kentrum sp. UNK TaxID=2126344 RepID=A0A451A2W4_9GAMM|nr:MAG: hypothetical protein BECKUNK1418G_GA0071005_101122 [Candidatus Kentron sp. UNK]
MKKIMKVFAVASLFALSSNAFAIDGWVYSGMQNGKGVWTAVRAGACAWINNSNGDEITSRSRIISKKKGDKIILRPGQGISDC